jgi:vacuolar-type H+-ATPase subunit H
MSSLVEKLKLVKEAEEKALQIIEKYRVMASESIAEANEEAQRIREREESRASEEGEAEMERIIKHAKEEAEEIRVEYMFDRARLLEKSADRYRKAVDFLLDRLENMD